MIRIGGRFMLVNSTQIIPRSQHEDDSALLRFKMEELNKNTVRLIAETEKLIQESKQLSERIKFFRES
jgi:tRNA U34 2-thiouridine synthase MnmA/TrmU